MSQQFTFLSPVEIYRFPEGTQEITYKTEPAGAVIIADPEPWAAAVNTVIEKQRGTLLNYLSECKPLDEKYAELRERLSVQRIEASHLGGELRFAITYELADGPQADPALLRDYAAVHLMTCSYLAAEEAVGFHRGTVFAFDLDPAEEEPIPGVVSTSIFEGLLITNNKLLTPEEMLTMEPQQTRQSQSM